MIIFYPLCLLMADKLYLKAKKYLKMKESEL
jgi:hypothetical protein